MANLNAINVFLKSKTPKGLIEIQLLNNHLNNMQFTYTIPTHDGKDWYVWFFADVTEWENPKGLPEKHKRFVLTGDLRDT